MDPQIRRFVDDMDWFIVPLLNPDGYEYTRSSTNPEVRLWRKNRSPMICRISQNGTFSVLNVNPERKIFKLFHSQKKNCPMLLQ